MKTHGTPDPDPAPKPIRRRLRTVCKRGVGGAIVLCGMAILVADGYDLRPVVAPQAAQAAPQPLASPAAPAR